MRAHFGDQVLKTCIPRSVRVSEAPSYGQTVMTYDPGSPGALCYLEAARELAEKGLRPQEGRQRERSRTQRRGLGRGLGSLIPTSASGRPRSPPATLEPGGAASAGPELAPVEGASFAELPIDAIRPNAAQPRQVFDEEAMAELVHSIREVGLLQPVVVRAHRRRQLRAGHGRAPVAGRPGGRAEHDPGDRPATPTTPPCSATRCWRTCTARS